MTPAAADEGRRDDGLDADIARIEAMRDGGTITAEEADRLIAVLRDVGDAQADLDAISGAPAAPEPPEAPAAPPPGSEPGGPSAPEPGARGPSSAPGSSRGSSGRRGTGDVWDDVGRAVASAIGGAARAAGDATRIVGDTPRGEAEAETADPAPEGTRWLQVSVLAADLDINGADVPEPEFVGDDGGAALERVGDGWRLRHRPEQWSWIGGSAPDLELRVPREIGVRLDVKAGDVRIRGVRAVTGRMMAGDLRLDEVDGIDLHKSAGDLDARVRLTRGVHRIVARAGDVDVTLLEGSDAQARATVSMGDARGGSGFSSRRRGMGAEVEGRVGAGAARLRVHLSAGDVRIDAEGGHG